MQINRLFETIYLLLDRKKMTAAELAEHFEVSVRTIHRDIETLSGAGVPIYAMKGKGGGIFLTENYVLNKSLLTEEERKRILQSLHGMNALKIEETEPVLSKLSALFGGEREDWIEIEFSSWNAEDAVSRRFSLFKEAIFSRRMVRFGYYGANGRRSERYAEPLRLVYRANAWYLYGWCREREDYRFFKLTRMEKERVLEETFERRIPWDAEKNQNSSYFGEQDSTGREKAEGGAGHGNIYEDKLVRVKAWISANKAYRILEELDKDCVEKLADGNYIAHITMPENDWLYQYLLTFGADMEILEPESVRNKMKKTLLSALKYYEI